MGKRKPVFAVGTPTEEAESAALLEAFLAMVDRTETACFQVWVLGVGWGGVRWFVCGGGLRGLVCPPLEVHPTTAITQVSH
jgi:hypothetical protein